MGFLFKVCDRSIIENPSEFSEFLATRRMIYDKRLHKNYTNFNVNLDEVDKVL